LWTECQTTNSWPGYSDDEVFLDASYDARTDWGGLTATAQGLTTQWQADAEIAEKIVAQHNWGG
jgi:hypothetical protein